MFKGGNFAPFTWSLAKRLDYAMKMRFCYTFRIILLIQPLGLLRRLPPSNLALRNRWDPAHQNIDANDDDANDPETLGVIGDLPEDDGKDDATQIATCAGETRHHTVCVRVDVRHE